MVLDKFDFFSELSCAEYREKTFIEWPFRKGSCTAKEMAKTGFYVLNSSDNTVSCYFCFKELDGWESRDIPHEEHKKHSPDCSFINMFDTPPSQLTFSQLIKLEKERIKRRAAKRLNEIFEKIDKAVESNNKRGKGKQKK